MTWEIKRHNTRRIVLGGVPIGQGAPIAVQSMTNTPTQDVAATVAQIQRLEAAGCEIVRVAVPDEEAARAVAEIKAQIKIPLIADIHFDHRLAVLAARNGADGLRINPGNIGGQSARIVQSTSFVPRFWGRILQILQILFLSLITAGMLHD